MPVKNQIKSSFYSVRRINSRLSHTNILYSLVMNLACRVIFIFKEVFTSKFAQEYNNILMHYCPW